jgi:predicted alternative tryptophan synthase beta-subunit
LRLVVYFSCPAFTLEPTSCPSLTQGELRYDFGATAGTTPLKFARAEGIVPAPESAQAIAAAVDEAEKCRVEGRKRVIVVGLSGNGLLDLAAYDTCLSGEMKDTGNDDGP